MKLVFPVPVFVLYPFHSARFSKPVSDRGFLARAIEFYPNQPKEKIGKVVVLLYLIVFRYSRNTLTIPMLKMANITHIIPVANAR